MSKRRQQQKAVAESRAPVFARPAQPSSTPTGLVSVKNKTTNKESWPGPFATALEIMSRRDEAKRRRLESIQNQQEISDLKSGGCNNNQQYKDEYDKIVSTLKWDPKYNSATRTSFRKIKTLNDLCIETFSKAPTNLSAQIVQCMSEDNRNKLLIQLAKLRLLTSDILLMFSIPDCNTLDVPECSQISEETILKVISIIGGSYDNDDNEVISTNCINIQNIQLHNCGLCIGDKVSQHLVRQLKKDCVEVLELKGLYRLSDQALSQLLVACQNSLKYLDLSANARFAELSMQSLRFDRLISLSLNQISHITDEHLRLMFHNYLDKTTSHTSTSTSMNISSNKNVTSSSSSSSSSSVVAVTLESLSLAGLSNITDQGVAFVLEICGFKLQSLCLSHCSQLTDESLVSIRTFCHSLKELDISFIPSFTTPALIGLFILHPSLLSKDSNNNDDYYDDDYIADDIDNNEVDAKGNNDINIDIHDPSSHDVMYIENDLSLTLAHQSIGRLEHVSLQGVNAVTDDVIIQLALCARKLLKSLNINGCYQVSSKSMIALSMYCANSLTTLDISFIRTISEDSLGYLLDKIFQERNGNIDIVDESSELVVINLYVWSCTQLTKKFYNNLNQRVSIVGQQSWLKL